MYYDAPSYILLRAKMLRTNQTEPEKKLWNFIKNKKLGVKFRRQHPINIFIADFYCHSRKLVIEIDGQNHKLKNQIEYDKERDEIFKSFGITTLRFKNEDVNSKIDFVIKKIYQFL